MEEEIKDIILTITMHGPEIKVDGPIRNEPLSLWLLDKAKDIIKISNIQANQPKVQPARGAFGIGRFLK